MKRKKQFMILLFFIPFILALVACGAGNTGGQSSGDSSDKKEAGLDSIKNDSNSNPDGDSINFGAHQPGIAYHSAASGISSVVSENIDGNLTVKPYSGPNAWMPALNSGELDMGILSYADMAWAKDGKNGYPKKNPNIRMLVRGNTIVTTGLTVRVEDDIQNVADLKGKRVASEYSGNQILQQITTAQLQASGLSWDDVEKVPVTDVDSGVEALRDGRVDAVFTGTPTVATFTEVDTTKDINGLNWAGVPPEDIDQYPEETVKKMESFVPGIQPATFKDGFLNKEKTLVSYPIGLAANADLSNEEAYTIVEVLWNNYEDLHAQFSWLETWAPEQMFDPEPPIPYHPGVVEFFEDEEIWTEKAEKHQEELLNEME
ncbi:TAXI family TRAP transporter solute-binding subunit [Lentibacillus halophilus]|uniref:TAXI family TRAP transporter solute-binding subunit n=1 Tax=Lentibacillus halophilus TaxID=295065 RepID=A0ABN0Z9H8_9BACI